MIETNPYVYLSSPYPPTYPTIYRTQTQSDGTFLLENLSEKRYFLWAYDSDGSGYNPSIYGFNKDMIDDPADQSLNPRCRGFR